MDGWLNIYKPRGISSARAVSIIKKIFHNKKIGHTGTLDLEAEGVLPIAIGQATKLVNILMDAKKEYIFTIQFGAKTDTADAAGKIIGRCTYIPTQQECINICSQFIGEIEQIPPIYSALKVNGQRAYKLARDNKEVLLKKRNIFIYDLRLLNYDPQNSCATYIALCSKGTYIRTLAEDISLSLQSLGFVLELARKKVGIFTEENSINIVDFIQNNPEEIRKILQDRFLKIESVLDDIPVLEVSQFIANKIACGQKCIFDTKSNYSLVWMRYKGRIIAIGSLQDQDFKSSRVFIYNN